MSNLKNLNNPSMIASMDAIANMALMPPLPIFTWAFNSSISVEFLITNNFSSSNLELISLLVALDCINFVIFFFTITPILPQAGVI